MTTKVRVRPITLTRRELAFERDLQAALIAASEARQALVRVEQEHAIRMQQAQDHIAVLQGDRDALTRTIEVLSRRLASPAADLNVTRAGYRYANAPARSHDQMSYQATEVRR